MNHAVEHVGVPGESQGDSALVIGYRPDQGSSILHDPHPASRIASELERLAADIDSWYRGSSAELAVTLQDALHALHRTIVAVRQAEVAGEVVSIPEHWFG